MIFGHIDRLLTRYIHDELSPSQRACVERHLSQCPQCRLSHDRLSAAHDALAQLSLVSAPGSLWPRIEMGLRKSLQSEQGLGHLGQLRRVTSARSTTRVRLIVVGAFALVILVVIIGWAFLHPHGPSWEVRTLHGRPVIGWFAFGDRGRLRVGDRLITDKGSQAEIEVADIGTVTVAPGSRVRLKATNRTEHRLELESGALEAKVTAPPRLFVVDTCTGKAIDLGCAYRLQTDGKEATILHVTTGQVAMEVGGRSSLVPKGFTCESRHSGGLGTPIKEDAPVQLQLAVHQFDFESGGDPAAERARRAARPPDVITLWHLLPRTGPEERGMLYATMARFSRPPNSVNRSGLLQGDAKMLNNWRDSILYDLAESEISLSAGQ